MSSSNMFDQQVKMKKKDLLKINTNSNNDEMNQNHDNQKNQSQYENKAWLGHEPPQFSQVRHSITGNQMIQNQPNPGQGISHMKQVASKGATGRKGSLPLSYQQINIQSQVNQQMYHQNIQNRQSQQNLAQNQQIAEVQNHQFPQATAKGANKSVKSHHAKYFSQQNSPVAKDKQGNYSNQNQVLLPHGGGIIQSQSGTGFIGAENIKNGNYKGIMNEMNNQSSHHTTGNFGSNMSNQMMNQQMSEGRGQKNISQISMNSNGSQLRDYKQSHYMQQLMANENPNSINANKKQKINIGPNVQHMKQISSQGGPVISQYAGNQTIASNGNSQQSNITQNTNQTFNASINKTMKSKHMYEMNYLNGPLNATHQQKQQSLQHQVSMQKRLMNNQSQQMQHIYEEQMRPQVHHKRVISSQMGQFKQLAPNEMNRTDFNYSQKNKSLNSKQPKTSQTKFQGDKALEMFQKSGNISYLNQNSIILSATNERMNAKNLKKGKAQTRPNSNSKLKQNQLQGSFLNDQMSNENYPQGNKKSQNTSINGKKQNRYVESQQAKRTPQSMLLANQQYNKAQQLYDQANQPIGNQNLMYYGMNKHDQNLQGSQGSIPIIQNHQSREKNKQQVVTVPQTMLHKSNKLMNNYLKQSTIQQPETNQNVNQNSQMFNKRLSTDQIMLERDQLSFSMKKQTFHQRAETQLKNPNNPGLLPFAQHYDNIKEGEHLGQSIQGTGSASNSFLVVGQHHNSLTNMINNQHVNNYQIGGGQKYANSKSQKSSTSRLINSTNGNQNKFINTQKNYQNVNQVQNSADRIPISQRSDNMAGIDSNSHHIQSVNINDMNYGGQRLNIGSGGVMTSNSTKQLIKNQSKNGKLNTLSNTQYPYQSSSTKSNKNITGSQKQNLSIAQIFQQKGLNYQGPSKISTNYSNQQSKIAQRMGVNGVIVHTKGGIGIKGSLTTSANTAQNSPRAMISNKQGMYAKNQGKQSNPNSIRKKPSTASITGASVGPSSQISIGHKKNSMSQKNSQQNMRTTSQGTAFKQAVKQSKTGAQSRCGSPLLYQDEVEMTEVAQFENTDKFTQLEPSKMNALKRGSVDQQIINNNEDENIALLQNDPNRKQIVTYKNHVKQQIVSSQNGTKKQLIIGAQPSTQYIADNGGTGSNPNSTHHNKNFQHEFYSQSIKQKEGQSKKESKNEGQGKLKSGGSKKNTHSNSLGNMQQFEIIQHKNTSHTGPHPTPKMSKSNKLKQIEVQPDRYDQFDLKEEDISYSKQIEDQDQLEGPLITEEEEQEIRQVASDINEKAFYGKILRAKQIIHSTHDQDSNFNNLSPRSQEIASVMKEIHKSFSKEGTAPETDINYYRIGKMLGRGAFGKVNLGMHKLVRKLVALKSLNKECLTDEVQKQKLMKEVNLLLKMRHDHVVKIYETIETKKHIIIVMELCAGGDLLNYVRKRRRLKEPYAKKIFKQIIEGLQYIHSKYVGHRDIKLDNILLDGKGSVKIADFGVSKQCQPGAKMREQCGTPAYIAPEILKNKSGYTFSVDLWSAGVVLFAMLYGTVPFKAGSMEELHSLILRGVYILKDDISEDARNLLRGLLEINPHKRLTIPEILCHPWLNDYDESLQLFNDTEREMIKKEYTYNDPSRYNRNENEEPIDCFTEHNIDSVYNTLKNVSDKSVILAPFNSTQSEDFESFKHKIKPMMYDKNLVLRLSRLCREVDRQYEFNNNGQLDNGVYHKQINNSAESDGSVDSNGEPKKKSKKKPVSDDEDDEAKFQVVQCSKTMGQEFNTEDYMDIKLDQRDKHGRLMSRMQELNLLNPSTMGTREMVIESDKVEKLLQFGYPYEYVTECLTENLPNYCSAGYYLLQMDQNYC